MFKDLIKAYQAIKLEKRKKKIFNDTSMSPLNVSLMKQLLEQCKTEHYAVVTLVDGNKIEIWSKKPDDNDPTKKQFNEYW